MVAIIHQNEQPGQSSWNQGHIYGPTPTLWEGDEESAEIAQRLGMEEKAVVLARRRLARRLKRLRGVGLQEVELNRRKRS